MKKIKFDQRLMVIGLFLLCFCIELTANLRYGAWNVYMTVELIAVLLIEVFLFLKKEKLLIIPFILYTVWNCLSLGLRFFEWIIVLKDLSMLAVVFISAFPVKTKLKDFIKYTWYIPGALFVIYEIWLELNMCYVTNGTLHALSYLALAYYLKIIAYKNIWTENNMDSTSESVSDGYCDLLKHALLLIFTFGIWQYIWIYRTTKYLNVTPDEEKRNPTNKLLLCMFVPFYYIYWTYKSAQHIDKLSVVRGISSDISTVCLILSIFVGIVPPIIMQDKINHIIKNKSESGKSTD